ncbi:MAG TPA: glycosyltransferase family 4 protein [Burkholderiaceae bacterium]|nr:glycosyltransferase family 4 protein [Burkholderiaceae bacterium]
MRIGISCNRFGRGGGLERYALDIAGALAAHPRDRVIVYAREFDEVPGMPPVEARRIGVRGWPGKWRDQLFSFRLQSQRRHCDVLISCNRVRGADIAICGGTHRGYLKARGAPTRLSDSAQIRLESDFYAGAVRVVAHSRLMRDELRELYGLPEDRIELLYPPVDTRRFGLVDRQARRALRERYGFAEDEIVFLFPSSGHQRKGLDLLADFFGLTALPVTLAVAGRPVGRCPPRVRELGYVADIENLYRAADFSILASDYEPFGLVGVESVLCGTPLVFADNIACLEVIGEGAVHAFSRRAPASLTAAIEQAVDRSRSGSARLPDPLAMLGYDPRLELHAGRLRELCEQAFL